MSPGAESASGGFRVVSAEENCSGFRPASLTSFRQQVREGRRTNPRREFLRAYLPSSDLDLTILIPGIARELDSDLLSKCLLLSRVRCQMDFVSRVRPQFNIRCVGAVHAEVELLKLQIRGLAVDLSVNQYEGLEALRLFELVDRLSGDTLFKRALFVAKAWATYEARIAGSQFGLLSSYALGVLIIYTLNVFPAARTSPMQVLVHLLQFLSTYESEDSVITCFGVMSLSDYSSGQAEVFGHSPSLMFTMLALDLSHQTSRLLRKYFNLADPLRPDNNLGRSITRGNFERIRLACEVALWRFHSLGEAGLFPSCYKPDINTTCGSLSASSGSDEERLQASPEQEETPRTQVGDCLAKPWLAARDCVRVRVETRSM